MCGRNIRPRFVDDYLSPPSKENISSGFVLQNFYLCQHFPSSDCTYKKLVRVNEACLIPKEDIITYYADHKGGLFYHHHNFAIFVPPGAVSQGECVEIQATANHYGPYVIPDGFYLISSFFWLSAVYTFKVPVYVVMGHYAKIRCLEDVSHLLVLQTCDKDHVMTRVSPNKVYFDYEIGYCVIATDHFCSFIQAMDTQNIPKFLTAYYYVYEVSDNLHIAEVCFCPSKCCNCEKVNISRIIH